MVSLVFVCFRAVYIVVTPKTNNMDSDNEIQLSIRMSAKFRDECKQLSDAAGQTLAEWIRRAMREKLEREVNGESDISDAELRETIRSVIAEMQEEKKGGRK